MLISDIENYIKKIDVDNSWSFADKTKLQTNYITHGYHRYPAKFIPQIVEPLIKKYSRPGDTVVDPFAGCGTTLVESKLLGRKSIGTDINPVACMITNAKITPIEPQRIEKEFQKLKYKLENSTTYTYFLSPWSKNEKIKYWFKEDQIAKLAYLYREISHIRNKDIQTFFFCGFSNILKNCSIWLQRSNKPTRDLDKVIVDPLKTFTRQIKLMQKGNAEYFKLLNDFKSSNLSCKIYKRDARKNPLDDHVADLVVTSPPYVTSYEYADFHQLSTLWFNYVKDTKKFRKKFIGTTYKTKKNILITSQIANNIIQKLRDKDKKMASEVAIYFSDMYQVIKEMKRILKNLGKIAIVIGNTKLKGIDILNAEVLVEQLQELNFSVTEIIKRSIPSKNLPSTRDPKSGKFTSNLNANKTHVYSFEYIIIAKNNL